MLNMLKAAQYNHVVQRFVIRYPPLFFGSLAVSVETGACTAADVD
jgi:hypothetical protein